MRQAIRDLDRGGLKDRPLVEAAVRNTIGQTLNGLGDLNGGEAQIRKALSLRRMHLPAISPDTAESLESLAVLLQNKSGVGGLAGKEGTFLTSLDVALRRNLTCLGDRRSVQA